MLPWHVCICVPAGLTCAIAAADRHQEGQERQ